MEIKDLIRIRQELLKNPKTLLTPSIAMEDKKSGIEPNPCWEGYEPIGLKDDGTPNCVPIKASKEKFVIPTPESGEAEKDYIDRCMAAIGGEYDDPSQAVAVCYAQLEKK